MTVKETNEWDNYRAIDLLKRIKREEIHERYIDRHKAFDMAIQALEEVEQYRALGTVEELKEAREKQASEKWVECPYEDLIMCPSCNAEFSTIDNCTEQFDYCPKCGKRLE